MTGYEGNTFLVDPEEPDWDSFLMSDGQSEIPSHVASSNSTLSLTGPDMRVDITYDWNLERSVRSPHMSACLNYLSGLKWHEDVKPLDPDVARMQERYSSRPPTALETVGMYTLLSKHLRSELRGEVTSTRGRLRLMSSAFALGENLTGTNQIKLTRRANRPRIACIAARTTSSALLHTASPALSDNIRETLKYALVLELGHSEGPGRKAIGALFAYPTQPCSNGDPADQYRLARIRGTCDIDVCSHDPVSFSELQELLDRTVTSDPSLQPISLGRNGKGEPFSKSVETGKSRDGASGQSKRGSKRRRRRRSA